jgi:hypothetical protein
MAFTYTEDLTNNRDFVRFYTGDTTEAESFLSDGIITSLLATEASKQHAVLSAIRYIIRQLSKPDFKADWLQVSYSDARKGYEAMLKQLQAEFGVTGTGGVGSSNVSTYRGDSATVSEPDFTGGRPGNEPTGTDDLYNISSEYLYGRRRSGEVYE